MSRLQRPAGRTPSLLLAVVVLLTAAAGPPRPPAEPRRAVTLSVSPTRGPAGSTVTLTGAGYMPGGYEGVIRWDGANRGMFIIPAGGGFSVPFSIPGDAAPGDHTITVCSNCEGEFEQTASAGFRVEAPPPPPVIATTAAPPPVITPTPDACATLALGPGAQVVDFETFAPGQVLEDHLLASLGVHFERSVVVVAPGVRAASPGQAGRSQITEFGSADSPIRMSFARAVQAVGMYVGMDGALETSGQVTAQLSAYGYAPGASSVTLLGQASATFPAGRVPLVHCVVYRAPVGALITQATLDYRSASVSSILEPRLIDDLTLVFSEAVLPEEQPPQVEITAPDEGQVFRGGLARLQATIHEDRALDRVLLRYAVPAGAREQWLPFSPGASPQEYSVTFDLAVESALPPFADVTLVVEAIDRAGLRGQDQVTVRYEPPPTPTPTPTVPALDLELVEVEVTQAVQCFGDPGCRLARQRNSIGLYPNRPTLVRVYVRSNHPTLLSGITGELCYWSPGEAITEGCPHRLEPLGPVTVENVRDVIGAHRGDLTRTLNFFLPGEALPEAGTLYLRVTLNPGRNPPECCYENNTSGETPRRFWVGRPLTLDVAFIPVQARGITAPIDERWVIADWVWRVYPISNLRVWERSRAGSLGVSEVEEAVFGGYSCGGLWNALLYKLWWHNFWTRDPVDWFRYYGMVDEGILRPGQGLASGCGRTPGDEAGGLVSRSPAFMAGRTAAEEIGHNHGRQHATSCGGAANIDGSYPSPDGHLDMWGTDVLGAVDCIGRLGSYAPDCNAHLYEPAQSYDFMGYCGVAGNTWISGYTYRALINAVQRVAGLPAAGGRTASPPPAGMLDGEVLAAAGLIEPDGVQILDGLVRVQLAGAEADGLPSGPYSVELLDAAGASVFARDFGPAVFGEAEPSESGLFFLILPWQEGVQAALFRYQGVEIGRVAASASGPTVTVLEPNGGERWPADGTRTIRWSAADADGDDLRAVVLYSADDGATWTALATGVQDGELRLDTAGLAGSQQARVRVVISDGFHTAQDDSDAPFAVAGKPPDAFLASPPDGAVYAVGWPVYFRAMATDLEDGPTQAEAAFLWRSSRDGDLGFGPELMRADLSTGRHTITLLVRDRDGQVAEQQITITIGSAEARRVDARTVGWLICVGTLLLGAASGMALAYLVWRRRRARA